MPGEKQGLFRKRMPENNTGIVKPDILEMKIGGERWFRWQRLLYVLFGAEAQALTKAFGYEPDGL